MARRTTTKQPALPKDMLESIRDRVRGQLRAGYDSLADVKRELKELDPEELFEEEEITPQRLRAEALAILDDELAALTRETKKWPKQTDNDRLDAAFRDLETDYAVLARQDYWCCQTCGCAAIDDEMAATKKGKKGKKTPGALGYVFFHNQDTESAVNNAGLYLAYGSAAGVESHTRAVGRVIVSVLQKHGLEPAWNDDVSSRIELPIEWRRRLPKRTVERP